MILGDDHEAVRRRGRSWCNRHSCRSALTIGSMRKTVRVIDAFVDALDLGDLGVVSSGGGRVYFPKAPVMKAGAKSIPNWISGKASATFFGRGFFRYWSSKTVNGSLLSAGRPNVCLRWRRVSS